MMKNFQQLRVWDAPIQKKNVRNFDTTRVTWLPTSSICVSKRKWLVLDFSIHWLYSSITSHQNWNMCKNKTSTHWFSGDWYLHTSYILSLNTPHYLSNRLPCVTKDKQCVTDATNSRRGERKTKGLGRFWVWITLNWDKCDHNFLLCNFLYIPGIHPYEFARSPKWPSDRIWREREQRRVQYNNSSAMGNKRGNVVHHMP